MLQKLKKEVRADNVLPHTYTFLDADGEPVNLSSYTSTVLYVKRKGEVYATVDGDFDDDPTTGIVTSSYAFPEPGTWAVQFACFDDSDGELWGNILQVEVAPNVPDLGLNQLPRA